VLRSSVKRFAAARERKRRKVKAKSQKEDVGDRDAFDEHRIGEGGGDVAKQQKAEGGIQSEAAGQTGGNEEERGEEYPLDGGLARGGEAFSFGRVRPVEFDVEQIVPEVGARGAQAHGEEGREQSGELPGGLEMMAGQEGHGDEQILRPLVDAQCFAPVLPTGAGHKEGAVHVELFGEVFDARRRPVDDDGLARLAPDGFVRRGIPRVVEAPLAEAFDEKFGLFVSFQIDLVRRGDDFVELKKIPDRSQCGGMAGGHENNAAAGGFFAFEPVQEFPVDGGRADRDGKRRGEAGFEVASSFRQPEGKFPDFKRVAADETQQALQEDVRMDQRAVEIHAERGLGINGRISGFGAGHGFSGVEAFFGSLDRFSASSSALMSFLSPGW
jgi:hypothetical protein